MSFYVTQHTHTNTHTQTHTQTHHTHTTHTQTHTQTQTHTHMKLNSVCTKGGNKKKSLFFNKTKTVKVRKKNTIQ
jgi:hypothetical protein